MALESEIVDQSSPALSRMVACRACPETRGSPTCRSMMRLTDESRSGARVPQRVVGLEAGPHLLLQTFGHGAGGLADDDLAREREQQRHRHRGGEQDLHSSDSLETRAASLPSGVITAGGLRRIGLAVLVQVGRRHEPGFRNGDQRQRQAAFRNGDAVLQELEVVGQGALVEKVQSYSPGGILAMRTGRIRASAHTRAWAARR